MYSGASNLSSTATSLCAHASPNCCTSERSCCSSELSAAKAHEARMHTVKVIRKVVMVDRDISFHLLMTPNGGVDAAARIKAPSAAPSYLRNTHPPLASNDLFGRSAQLDFYRRIHTSSAKGQQETAVKRRDSKT